MVATALLTEIYESKEVRDVIAKLKPVHLQQDILQHTFCELFQKPHPFIEDLHERGKLKSYIVKILYNTATYHRTSFEREQGKGQAKEIPTDFCISSPYEVIRFVEEEKERQQEYSDIACAVAKVYWYKADLIKLYAELGTYQAVAKQTGIPISSVFKTIKETRQEIKKLL